MILNSFLVGIFTILVVSLIMRQNAAIKHIIDSIRMKERNFRSNCDVLLEKFTLFS
jgi:hypothetical protein